MEKEILVRRVDDTEVIGVLPELSGSLGVADGKPLEIKFVWDYCGWIVWFRNKKTNHDWTARIRNPNIHGDGVWYLETHYGRPYQHTAKVTLIRASF